MSLPARTRSAARQGGRGPEGSLRLLRSCGRVGWPHPEGTLSQCVWCVFVPACSCTPVTTHACVCKGVQACAHACMHSSTFMCTYIREHMFKCAHAHTSHNAVTCACTYSVCRHMHVYLCTCACVCEHAFLAWQRKSMRGHLDPPGYLEALWCSMAPTPAPALT